MRAAANWIGRDENRRHVYLGRWLEFGSRIRVYVEGTSVICTWHVCSGLLGWCVCGGYVCHESFMTLGILWLQLAARRIVGFLGYFGSSCRVYERANQ